MNSAHSTITYPNGHTTERTFRFRQVDENLCRIIAATLHNGGTFSIRPATKEEENEGGRRVQNVQC